MTCLMFYSKQAKIFENKIRIYHNILLYRFPTSVCSLSFSPDGGMLAIAATYLYEEDVDPHPLPESSLTIRKMTELEVRPKYGF